MEYIIQQLSTLTPIQQTIIATLFTWGLTALGAALVFFFKTFNQRFLDSMLGFAAGVMIAASFWSLLAPAIELAEVVSDYPKWFAPLVGFMSGGIFLAVLDKYIFLEM